MVSAVKVIADRSVVARRSAESCLAALYYWLASHELRYYLGNYPRSEPITWFPRDPHLLLKYLNLHNSPQQIAFKIQNSFLYNKNTNHKINVGSLRKNGYISNYHI